MDVDRLIRRVLVRRNSSSRELGGGFEHLGCSAMSLRETSSGWRPTYRRLGLPASYTAPGMVGWVYRRFTDGLSS
jgi:hypothetical protein